MRFPVIVVCLFAVGCAADGVPTPTSPSSGEPGSGSFHAAGGTALPFRGTLEATETVDGAAHHLVGTGHATHLGRFQITSDFTVTPPPARTASGTAVWTASNGDQLFTTVSGAATLALPFLVIRETHTITGGTGRFAGASGALAVERQLNVSTLASTASLDGTFNLGR